MSGASYHDINQLVLLDRDLKTLGISDRVSTPDAGGIALAAKDLMFDYIRSIARGVAHDVVQRDVKEESQNRELHGLDGVTSFIPHSPKLYYSFSKKDDNNSDIKIIERPNN